MGCLFFAMTAKADDGLTVKTADGKVHGKASQDGQVRTFLGIPYAAPPVGALRWKAPQAAEKWSGVREATEFGNRCIPQNAFPDMHYRDPGPSEDCLTLNVWTPAKDKKAKLPVMVWIYGGGFTAGTTSEPRQDGEHLATKGVIVVSMNYRLGVFGFLALPGLAIESSDHAAGDYGLMDQTAALEWVKKNIAAFGGDPKNVTLFGESAGSISVSAQMASPMAQGLFAHAIGESGGAFPGPHGPLFKSLADAEMENAAYAAKAFGTADVAALRAMSADDLLAKIKAAAETHTEGGRFWPDVDGHFLPEPVSEIYKEGKQAHIPLLAGWNRDEPSATVARYPQPATVQSFTEMAQKEFGERAAEFLQLYPATTDAEAVRSTIDFAGNNFITFATWEWLEAQVATGNAPVYRYHFERPSPEDKFHAAGSGAFHSDEIEYVFGTLDSRIGATWQPEDRKLSDLIETYWTNFARTGNPNGGEAGPDAPLSSTVRPPVWPQYDEKGGWQVMHLDVDSHAGPDTERARDLFLKSVWLK
ncbi:MAG TPA: carboxylesterase family protein [Acidobacteriaceae bacterium]|jgi:para-nitrobenzyl esterase|nr:carboxylesterase family protein [Acidobacteriaceae bacterium]